MVTGSKAVKPRPPSGQKTLLQGLFLRQCVLIALGNDTELFEGVFSPLTIAEANFSCNQAQGKASRTLTR